MRDHDPVIENFLSEFKLGSVANVTEKYRTVSAKIDQREGGRATLWLLWYKYIYSRLLAVTVDHSAGSEERRRKTIAKITGYALLYRILGEVIYPFDQSQNEIEDQRRILIEETKACLREIVRELDNAEYVTGKREGAQFYAFMGGLVSFGFGGPSGVFLLALEGGVGKSIAGGLFLFFILMLVVSIYYHKKNQRTSNVEKLNRLTSTLEEQTIALTADLRLPTPVISLVDTKFSHIYRIIQAALNKECEDCCICRDGFDDNNLSDLFYALVKTKSDIESPYQGPYHEECLTDWVKRQAEQKSIAIDPLSRRTLILTREGSPRLFSLAATLKDFKILQKIHSKPIPTIKDDFIETGAHHVELLSEDKRSSGEKRLRWLDSLKSKQKDKSDECLSGASSLGI